MITVLSLSRPGNRLSEQQFTKLGNPLLHDLLDSSILPGDDWLELAPHVREELAAISDKEVLLNSLMEKGLLTEYQAARVQKGMAFGMVLGNYRLLDRIGAGGMGIVYLCEHTVMRRQLAIKVLSDVDSQSAPLVMRFYSEM